MFQGRNSSLSNANVLTDEVVSWDHSGRHLLAKQLDVFSAFEGCVSVDKEGWACVINSIIKSHIFIWNCSLGDGIIYGGSRMYKCNSDEDGIVAQRIKPQVCNASKLISKCGFEPWLFCFYPSPCECA